MKLLLITITAIIFSIGIGCSQVESLNSDSSDSNSETIIELQNQVNELEKENILLMEKYQELENKLNNYNLVKKPLIEKPNSGNNRPKTEDKNPIPENGERCQLNGGEMVPNLWSGKDTSSNYCNQCTCMNGALACTKMACNPDGNTNNEFAFKDFWKWYNSPEMEAQVMVRGFNVPSKAEYASTITGIENITLDEAKRWSPTSNWANPYI